MMPRVTFRRPFKTASLSCELTDRPRKSDEPGRDSTRVAGAAVGRADGRLQRPRRQAAEEGFGEKREAKGAAG